MQHIGPRDYSLGAGMPGDRGARLAARQAFVDLKLSFLDSLQGSQGVDWLLAQVRAAEEPVDLWLLRAPVLATVAGATPEQRQRRQHLRRSLDSVFPDLELASAFSSI